MRHLILYDGTCGLCHRVVQFVLGRDRDNIFAFAALQSDSARSRLLTYGCNPDGLDTIYLVADAGQPNEHLLTKGRAALFILEELGGLWRGFRVLGILPTRILDAGYSVAAKHRYRWFGKHEHCILPSETQRAKFLDGA